MTKWGVRNDEMGGPKRRFWGVILTILGGPEMTKMGGHFDDFGGGSDFGVKKGQKSGPTSGSKNMDFRGFYSVWIERKQ
jgi:hypothetical protein